MSAASTAMIVVGVVNLAVLGAFVFLVLHGHPWMAAMAFIFVMTGKTGKAAEQ